MKYMFESLLNEFGFNSDLLPLEGSHWTITFEGESSQLRLTVLTLRVLVLLPVF